MHRLGELSRRKLLDPADVRLGERIRAPRGLLELTLRAVVNIAVDERSEIPLGVEQFGIGEQLGGSGHRPKGYPRALFGAGWGKRGAPGAKTVPDRGSS